ncbi:fibronectin type III domain-containing protein [Ferruginibacter albus]|uniref:fibronectin type III domain-containing protein n=1 Tax=Ferruginibacter albus TaxID=2875540 RepID=UPI001CC8201E|nr:fibronectin type III domain-containing protein [Ferruginibacter albus]UAY52677.1 fibronectin type III domain-containing protein [Ferruginibacter albus]
MKNFLLAVLTLVTIGLTSQYANGQAGVLKPNDAYAPFPSTVPAYGSIAKWSNSSKSNTYGFQSYYFNGMAFRLKFPKSYSAGDNKTYPVFVFIHGAGEYGTIYDNNQQLYWGGQLHAQAVDNGKFDGFLLYPQSTSGWLQPYAGVIFGVLDSMIKYIKADPDRVIVSGLSGGGQATWDFLNVTYSPKIAAAIPLSAAKADDIQYFPDAITIPVWMSNGGVDNDPAPPTATQVVDTFTNLGGNIKQSFYPTLGHDTWESVWADADYFPFLNRQNKTNPLVYFQETQFCNGQVNARLALQPGFFAYQWMKDSVMIDTAVSSQLLVTQFGTYVGRYKRTETSDWSSWSPTPVVISPKSPSITPLVQVNGPYSNVLPSPDGNTTTVPLTAVGNYASYEWHKVDNGDTIVGSAKTLNAAIGQYQLKAADQSGCSSGFSAIFKVVNANGANGPDKVVNVTGAALSKTSIQLDWNDNPNPAYNETAFEIYRSTTSGAGYQLVAVKNADVLTHVDLDLTPGTKYYYIIRSVNNNGASPISNEVSVTTQADVTAPTAPSGLVLTASTSTTASLSWNTSTDDVGVYRYDIYINGVKSYSTASTDFTVVNLTANTLYAFTVKARDIVGNVSPASNQVVVGPVVTSSIPTKPSALNVTATSYNKISLSWTDNSSNETGFEIVRSTDRVNYTPLTTVTAGTASFVDSIGLSASTKYWYKVRAINANGASAFVTTFEAGWNFNGDLTDASGNGYTLTPTGTTTYSTDKVEGTNAVSLDGSTQYFDLANSTTFPNNSITARTISVWVKPTAATISGSNKIIYDLGSSTVGIGLRFNSGALQAGVAGSILLHYTAVVNNIATDANWVSNGWNHIVVVYNTNTLQLYVNKVLKATTSLGVSSLGTSTTGFRIGATNSTNAFSSAATSTNYAGLIDDFEMISEPLNATGVTALYNQTYAAATTSALPSVPAAPTSLVAQATSTTKVSVSFTDNANNETGFEVYRSVTDTGNFKILTTLTAGSNGFTDSTVFPNAIYYYKVRAIGIGGSSAFSNIDSASTIIITVNHPPVIAPVADFTLRYDASKTVTLTATDADNDPIVFTPLSAPSFAVFTNGVSGTATMQVGPTSIADTGVYTISVVAKDNHAATDTITFKVTVNANYLPTVTAVSNQTVNEADSLSIQITANDQDGNAALVWSLTNAPFFATISGTVNGVATVTFKPNYASSGTYPITLTVLDAAGDTASTTFTLTVVDVTPPTQKIFMDMRYNSPSAPAPWNNITGISSTNLLNSDGQSTTVGLQFLNTPWNAGNASNSTGNNSAIYPDAAIADYFWFGIYGAPETVSFQLTGLDPSAKYNLNLFSSSTWQGAGPNGSTVFTINGVAKSVNANYNLQNTAAFTSLLPDASGNITVAMSKAANTPYGMINDIVLEKQYNDNSVPALPTNVTAQALSNGSVQLTWKDNAFNENNYLVYRATSAAGTYTALNAGATNANDTSFTDATVSAGSTYYYKIEATNANGSSGLTAPVSVTVASIIIPATEKIYMDMRYTTPSASAPWNNITGVTTNNLLNSNGQSTTVGLAFLSTPWNTGNASNSTGNNSGVYPDAAIADYFWFGIYGAPETVSFRLTGLDLSTKYNVTLYSGSNWHGAGTNGTINYTINSVTKSLNAESNVKNTVTFTNLTPDASGYITVALSKGSNTPYGMLNTIMLEKQVNDATAPIMPTNLAAQVLSSGYVKLTWKDFAYNEDNYLVYRATAAAGPYTLLNVGATNANDTSYTDNTTAANTTYYYKIEATNVNGSSGQTAPVTAVIGNLTPPTQKVYMDMRYTTAAAPAPWNNISGVTSAGLLDDQGQATSIGLQFLSTPWNTGNASNSTGNNSGVYSDAAIADYFWFGAYGAPDSVTFRLTGLDAASKYNVTLFSSSTWQGAGPNGTVLFTLNGVQKSIYTEHNLQTTATFSAITPDASGYITIKMNKGSNTPYGMLNDIVLEKQASSSTPPVAPTNLAAQLLSNGSVQLTWKDVSNNEDNFLVSRSTTATGTYTTLNAGATNAGDTSYIDATALGNTTYYYKVAASNAGGSASSPAVTITTVNKIPALAVLKDTSIKGGVSATINVTATDDPSNTLTTTVTGLPSFATYTSTGNGTGKIAVAPTVNDLGIYKNVIVKVSDNFGASVVDTFNIYVVDSALRTVYINFGPSDATPQARPWNNYLTYPFVNFPLTGLLDDNNVNTGFSIKLNDQWENNFNIGMVTGDNSGVVPDNVMKGSIETSDTLPHVIEIGGLNPAKKYDIGIVSSFDGGVDATATYTSGTASVTFNGMYNSNTVAYLNGLTPNASGIIQVTAKKAASATYMNLNAIEIHEYVATTTPVRPFNLIAESILSTSQIKLTWSDRSTNETGFQIYRATSQTGTYSLVTTTSPGVTTYTNTGLTANTRYYYKVRAINGSTISSNYSNIASEVLPVNIVYINLNASSAQNAPSPWNNTSGPSTQGLAFPNLINGSAVNTGFQMTITKALNGAGFAGSTVSNGLFPANVMTSNYWTDASQHSEVKFDNLDVRKKYRIGIFGSAINFGYFLANYSCNGKTVQLNSYNNSTKIVYLDNLTPNQDGELYIDITPETGYPYCFTSAFTIEYFDDVTAPVLPILNRPIAETEETVPVADVNVYPNPFTDHLTVELNSKDAGRTALGLYDISGRLLYRQEVTKGEGKQTFNINIPNAASLKTGNYIFNVNIDGKLNKSVILLKGN